ncbi:MAG: hypothetical protein A2Y33_13240 [Spirochaetes bacterium GWF1_51_8]|nr:MAG: hypothetical protein A2Y33_13240 [Spirochaetes bacterium GWF1_51_8]
MIAEFAGVRASGYPGRDFVIEPAKDIKGILHIAGIDSPGFVSAPAIALYAIEMLREMGLELREKRGWNPLRAPKPHFRDMPHSERMEAAARDSAYGRVVCRCEEVTEGEVIDAVRGVIPALSYDAVKRRTWLGTGRCQGAFDYPRVIEILAAELGIPVTEVTKRGGKSRFIFRATKEVDNE